MTTVIDSSNQIRIITWNVNGLRSRVFNNKISAQLPKKKIYTPEEGSAMYNLIKNYDPIIVCLQETRCDEQLGKLACIPDYNSYFNSSKLTDARGANRYSGTAIYTKLIPINIEYTVPDYIDMEGRIMIMYFEQFIVINVYSPNSGTNYDNKIIFQRAILNFILFKINQIPETKIIYCGDFNMAIDTHFDKNKVKPMPGIYKHELDYYDELLNIGLKDSKDTGDNLIFTWWDQRSKKIVNPETNKETNILRYKNRGWRLDYIFTININLSESYVLKHIGEEYCPHSSDHAPVCCYIFI